MLQCNIWYEEQEEGAVDLVMEYPGGDTLSLCIPCSEWQKARLVSFLNGGLTKGDRVLARRSGSDVWERRIFSHFDKNTPHCFTGGKDEWGSYGETTPWAECKKWEGDAK